MIAVMALGAGVPVLANAASGGPFAHTSAVQDQYTGTTGTTSATTTATSTTTHSSTSSISGTNSHTATSLPGNPTITPGSGLPNGTSSHGGPVLIGAGATAGLPFTGLGLLTIVLMAAALIALGMLIRVALRLERRLRSDPAGH